MYGELLAVIKTKARTVGSAGWFCFSWDVVWQLLQPPGSSLAFLPFPDERSLSGTVPRKPLQGLRCVTLAAWPSGMWCADVALRDYGFVLDLAVLGLWLDGQSSQSFFPTLMIS